MEGICIYCKKTAPQVHFTKEEHVIPAGLGGINKLPLGSVSDEINEMFSPIELRAMRKSLLGAQREKVGPGKRGSLNIKKVKNPRIRLFKDVYMGNEIFHLGYLFLEQVYGLPQILLLFNDQENSFLPIYWIMNNDIQQGKR